MLMEHSYRVGKSRLTLKFGDLTTSTADVIVSSDDTYISMGGGVSAAILRIGGEAIALDAAKKVPAALGEIVVTTAGALKAQYVFHAITIGPNPKNLSNKEIVEKTTKRCMQLLEGLQLSSIAFPAIGAGAAGFAYEDVAATMANVIAEKLTQQEAAVDVTIFLFDRYRRWKEDELDQFFQTFVQKVPRIVAQETEQAAHEVNVKVAYSELAAATQEESMRQRLHNLRLLLVTLEDQRGKLEQQLISAMGEDKSLDVKKARASLKENQKLRIQYLKELQSYASSEDKGQPVASPQRHQQPLTVFVSSTYTDLVDARTAVKDAIARCDLFFRGMEHFGAFPDSIPPATRIIEEVRKAKAYLGIFGMRYGSIDPATGLSMTELEFREAETQKMPMLLYVLHSDAPIIASQVESNPDSFKKLNELKADMLGKHVVYRFKNVDDLAGQVRSDLLKLKEKV